MSVYDEARRQLPVLANSTYLNAGTFGPLATATAVAVEAWERRELEEGRSGAEYFDDVVAARERARAELAGLVGVAPEQVALVSSTTEGCSVVLQGLGLRAGDEVVTTSDEHFGLLGPLHATGSTVRVVAPGPDAILAAITSATRLLAVSRVLWTTGALLPVRELAEAAGVPVLVDGAQAVGAIPVQADEVDFMTISAQKWLCAPDGVGALVVRDPERLSVARPSYFGQSSYEPDGSFTPREGALRFDSLAPSPPAVGGLLAALAARPEGAFERLAAMATLCRERLSEVVEVVTPSEHAGLISWREEGDAAARVTALAERGVIIRDLPGRGLLRASCGWWTNEDDIERLVAALRESAS